MRLTGMADSHALSFVAGLALVAVFRGAEFTVDPTSPTTQAWVDEQSGPGLGEVNNYLQHVGRPHPSCAAAE